MKTILALLLAALFAAPTALAADSVDTVDLDVDCGGLLTHGVIPVTLCLARAGIALGAALAKYGFCAAWSLLWGPGSPCPLV